MRDLEIIGPLGSAGIEIRAGDTVRYIGSSDEQVRWGSNDDPRTTLVEGACYTVYAVEVHTWHTKLYLKERPGWKFNSVSFELAQEREGSDALVQ